MVVVHSGRGPLDMCHCCGGCVVIVKVAFTAPAGDVEGSVLVAIGQVEETGRRCRGICGGVENCVS